MKKGKKIFIVVAIILIIAGIKMSNNEKVTASTRLAKFKIESFLGTNKNVKDYKDVVDSKVSNNGMEVQLKEVIWDKNELLVDIIVELDGKMPASFNMRDSAIYINGKKGAEIHGESDGKLEGNKMHKFLSYYLDEDLQDGKLNIEIEFNSAEYFNNNNDNKIVKGPWNFEFVTSRDNLICNTDVVSLDNSFVIEGSQKVRLNQYRSNSLGQKICYSVESKDKKYCVNLKGHDNLGNEVMFYFDDPSKANGVMKCPQAVSKDAETLTLTPYAQDVLESGGLDSNVRICGEEFTIKIR